MNNKEGDKITSYFDNTAEEYARVSGGGEQDSIRSYIFSSRKRYVLDMFDLKAGRVLDIGCGPAVLTEELLKNNCEVWGIDVSDEMVKEAKKRMEGKGFSERIHFNMGDIERLDFPDAYFDFVLCIGVIEYLKEPSRGLTEIRRVLKDKGKLIVSVPNMATPFVLFDKMALYMAKLFLKSRTKVYPDRLCFRDDIIVRYYLPWRFNRLLSDNGFSVDKTVFHAVRSSVLNAISSKLALFFIKKLEFLSTIPLIRRIGINYIVKASKEQR